MEAFAKKGYFYYASLLSMAIAFGSLHCYHVSTLFENDRHFSHLSELEREMTFRTEMGLYYHYYKRLVQSSSFLDGLVHIMNDNLTEYPSTINTLQRFNLYPEIILGSSYKIYTGIADVLGIETKQCWQVDRGDDLPPVWSCEGLGDPIYFYLAGVWFCAGLTVALIFIYGTFLSDSALGGIISVLCFFYNHGECTRVQWTPPLRESFAYPLCLAQMLCVSLCLRKRWPHWIHVVTIGVTTSAALVTWQFAQFAFLTQNIAVVTLWSLQNASRPSVIVVFLGQLIGLQNAVLLLFANEMLLTSFYACTLMATLLVIILLEPYLRRYSNYYFGKTAVIGVCIATSTISLRNALSLIVGTGDDAHILNLLRAKFSDYQDFHTMLYTCAAEFDFLPLSTIYKLSSTLLLPTVYVVVFCIALHMLDFTGQKPVERQKSFKAREGREVFIGKQRPEIQADEVRQEKKQDAAVMYTLLQLSAFVIMSVLVMRLKLFMTPHLCIVASLVASRKYMSFISSRWMHYSLLVALISAMSYNGLRNIREQHSIVGEFSSPPLEELLTWVNTETSKEAAFAGPMPIMASILLSTQRPVVNHPHYEDAGLRERTKKVYRAFGRGTIEKFYRTLVEMKVSYLVLEDKWCYGQQRPGCSMLNVWDAEEPAHRSLPPLCPQLIEGNPSPLQRVFSNDIYVVLRVPSRFVEVKLPRQFKE